MFFNIDTNTYTNREWGDGKEDLWLFDSKDLDASVWCGSKGGWIRSSDPNGQAP